MIAATILVGGGARRFQGTSKPTLTIGDRTILDRQRAAVAAAGIRDVILVGRWAGLAVPGVRHVPDVMETGGALCGLYSALLAAPTALVLVLAGDLPFVSGALIRELAVMGHEHDAVVPRVGGRWHPLCAVYHQRVALGLKRRLDAGTWRITDALNDMRVRDVTVDRLGDLDSNGMLLMNVNTPDDHQQAERLLRPRS
ncbi:MAG: molybdenum cofactor guanylyltransferase [Acidobacteria bacterium]|nr:molybdenum cofactor guanylyltransferase [Acidobacteriota bacterium]